MHLSFKFTATRPFKCGTDEQSHTTQCVTLSLPAGGRNTPDMPLAYYEVHEEVVQASK